MRLIHVLCEVSDQAARNHLSLLLHLRPRHAQEGHEVPGEEGSSMANSKEGEG